MAEQPQNDLHLENVEDYTTDYPPEYPGEEGVEVAEGEKRVGLVRGLVIANKKMTALLALVFVLIIAIVTILVAARDENANEGFHQPLIFVDPSTLDSSVTVPLMETLVSAYKRNGVDPSPLHPAAGDDTPQRLAFFWLAHDNQSNLDHTTKMHRYALAVFYYSTNYVANEYVGTGDSEELVKNRQEELKTWFSARLWLTKANFCEWHGIECDERQRVLGIALDQNYLTGKLPTELFFMKDTLEYLTVSSNLISMEDSDFDVFMHLDNLEELVADDNFFEHRSGLPTQMASLENLRKLSLSYNLFEGKLEADTTDPVIGAMPKLTYLEMESNYLAGPIPGSFGSMSNLVYLYMSRNSLSGDLSFLHLGLMSRLFALWLDGNDITGTIPTEVGSLRNLASLSLTKCKLTGNIPTEVGNASNLQRLWLYSNDLSGTIPNSISNLSKLQILELHRNKLGGGMPNGICNLFQDDKKTDKELTADCENEVSCAKSCCTECF